MNREYKFKGTPAPWYAVNYAGFINIQDKDQYGSHDVTDANIVGSEETAILNGSLLAAAPDLLDALTSLNTALDNYWNSHTKPDSLVKAITRQQQKSLAAIHKALNL